MVNESILKGKWTEFKGEVQQAWGKITGDDLDRTKGNIKAIGGLFEQAYGELKEDARAAFDSIVAKYRGEAEAKMSGLEEAAADKTEAAKNDLQDRKNSSSDTLHH